MKAVNWGKIPFDELKIVTFRVFDKEQMRPYFDSTDEQIFKLLVSEFHETVHIVRTEKVEVLGVVTYKPERFKLDVSELKASIDLEERTKRDNEIKRIKNKFEEQ